MRSPANGYGAFAGLLLGVGFSGSISLVGDQLFPSGDPFLFVAFWAFVFALVETGLVLILLAVFGSDTRRPVEIAQVMLPHAVSTALVAPWVFRLAQRLQPATGPGRGGSEAMRA